VLQGLQGPIEVDGEEWNLIMPPPAAALNDEYVAAILTYVRRSWGNESPPIDPETGKRVREQTQGRTEPWTVKELLNP